MYKKIAFALCGCFLTVDLLAQSSSMASVLQAIEENNTELQAKKAYQESKLIALKSTNNLPDPQFGAYYLPFGTHDTGDYSEWEITQSFEFPSVYRVRNALRRKQEEQLVLSFAEFRQQVLLKAQSYCLQIIHLNKRLALEIQRVDQAKTVFDQIQKLFDEEQVGILELNKAKIAWMQEQFKVQELESNKKSIQMLLESLNGGKPMTFDEGVFLSNLELESSEIVWQQRLSKDPILRQLKQEEAIATDRLQLSKSQSLPNITAGYNYQGVAGANYSGVYAGLSIPLWSNKNKVKAAQSHLQYQQIFASSKTMQAEAVFNQQFNEYQLLLAKFKEYDATLKGLNSEALLLQAYELQEMSFIEYHQELRFYRQAYDTMLDMQYQLHTLQTELLKHQL